MEYVVNLIWDAEASVWIATSGEIPGLILESGSLDALIERLRFAIPELLLLNQSHEDSDQKPVSLCFRSERREQVYA